VECPEHYARIDADPNLTAAQKGSFCLAVDSAPSGASLETVAEAFFNRNKRKGPSAVLPHGTFVGRVMIEVAFRQLLIDALHILDDDVDAHLASWERLDPRDALAEVRALLSGTPMHAYMLWVFWDQSHPRSPGRGTEYPLLPCRLGIETLPGTRFYYWAISGARGLDCRVPTAFDPGMRHLPNWEAGGCTNPLSGCTHFATGLPEAVAAPPTFAQAAHEFRGFLAR